MSSSVVFTITIAILCPSIVYAGISQLPLLKDQNDSSSPVWTIPVPSDRSASIALPEGSAQLLRNTTDSLPGPWVADMFYQALSNFTVHDDAGTTACQKQVQMYVRDLKNNSYWAVKSKYKYL